MHTPEFSPAAEQNKQAILAMLLHCLPTQGSALEIASGTGQHVAWFARHLPGWTWQPTDAQPNSLGSIQAHVAQAGVANVLPPRVLDVLSDSWLAQEPAHTVAPQFDLIYCANMLHISPPATGAALMLGSARHLAPGGVLVTYGPYLEDEVPTTPSNLAFDASLRQRNPAWGVRRREDLERAAASAGLRLTQRHTMPANNLTLVWSRAPITPR